MLGNKAKVKAMEETIYSQIFENDIEEEKEKNKEIYIPTLDEVEQGIIESARKAFIKILPYINRELKTDGYSNRGTDNSPSNTLLLEMLKENYEQEGYTVIIQDRRFIVYHPKYPHNP